MRVLIKRVGLFFVIFMGYWACRALKTLTLTREDNSGGAFRIDGFYFSVSPYQTIRGTTEGYSSDVFVFYGNGVSLNFTKSDDTMATKQDWEREWRNYFLKSLAPNQFDEVPYWWGVYNIRGDSIRFEEWVSTDYYYRTLLSAGKILNDTTLLWRTGEFGKDWKNEVSYAVKDQTLSEKADILYFAPLDQKPDSTNKWIR